MPDYFDATTYHYFRMVCGQIIYYQRLAINADSKNIPGRLAKHRRYFSIKVKMPGSRTKLLWLRPRARFPHTRPKPPQRAPSGTGSASVNFHLCFCLWQLGCDRSRCDSCPCCLRILGVYGGFSSVAPTSRRPSSPIFLADALFSIGFDDVYPSRRGWLYPALLSDIAD